LTKKLIVIMANSDPNNAEELRAPIFQASAAAALEYEVAVVFTAGAGRLMQKGVPEMLAAELGNSRTVYDFIKDANLAGVKFYCCSPNVESFDVTPDELIPECSGIIGATQLIEQIMEHDDVRVLSY
jgi:predicted peroxiredoxin